jgi:outer membrane protein assembly factor BamE (lipoprotein component of BamABCDE complex)
MRRKGWKLWTIVAAVAAVAVSLWFIHHQRDRREAAEPETHYQATLTEYSANVKPGMTREQVVRYETRENLSDRCAVLLTSDTNT